MPNAITSRSCDIAYRDALARAERCHQDGEDDCEIEDQRCRCWNVTKRCTSRPPVNWTL